MDRATIAMVRDCQSNTLVTPRFVDIHIALYIFIRYTTFPAGVNHAFGYSGQLFPEQAAKLLTVKSIATLKPPSRARHFTRHFKRLLLDDAPPRVAHRPFGACAVTSI
jgi:hypothetical protein